MRDKMYTIVVSILAVLVIVASCLIAIQRGTISDLRNENKDLQSKVTVYKDGMNKTSEALSKTNSDLKKLRDNLATEIADGKKAKEEADKAAKPHQQAAVEILKKSPSKQSDICASTEILFNEYIVGKKGDAKSSTTKN